MYHPCNHVPTAVQLHAMARAVTSSLRGSDYQARFFWWQASRLFQEHTKVERVAYEYDELKSFDDVVVFYSQELKAERDDPYSADYFQVKFHVNYNGSFTCDALIDPDFINATSVSLLQRLRNAQMKRAPNGTGARFIIISPWTINPADALKELVSTVSGEIRLDRLFHPDKKVMREVRKLWREHLELDTDEELECVLRPLRIWSDAWAIARLGDLVSQSLLAVGLKPVDAGSKIFPYTPLIQELHANGRNIFTRDELQQVCESEGLWCRNMKTDAGATAIGIHSFMRRAENMSDWTESMLCLTPHFNERSINVPKLWETAIYPEVRSFLASATRVPRTYHIYLDTHSSIAFAAGYELDAKTGVDITPLQSTVKGRVGWEPDTSAPAPKEELWEVEDIPNSSADADDVALAINVSHDIAEDVRHFVRESLPSVCRIIACRVRPRPSSAVVRDATHAFQLIEELVVRAIKQRSREERKGRLHIFAAAPNAMLFFLGQMARSFGRCVVYEFDFDSSALGAYVQSLQFPPP
jgi:hypothetical protein